MWVYPVEYYTILKKVVTATYNIMDQSHKYYTELKKQNILKNILYFPITC